MAGSSGNLVRSSAKNQVQGDDQGRTPMRNFLAPQSAQVERVAGRPFFMVTA